MSMCMDVGEYVYGCRCVYVYGCRCVFVYG